MNPETNMTKGIGGDPMNHDGKGTNEIKLPPCVSNINYNSKEYIKVALKVWEDILGWDESKILDYISVLAFTQNVSEDEILELWNEVKTKKFCEVAKELGLCKDCKNPPFSPIDKLIEDMSNPVLNKTTGVVYFEINGRPFEYKLKDFYKVTKEGMKINLALLYEIYLYSYLKPPIKPITEEDGERFLEEMLKYAEIIEGDTEEQLILERIVELLLNMKAYKFDRKKLYDEILSEAIFIDEETNKIYVWNHIIYLKFRNYSEKTVIKALRPVLIKEGRNTTKLLRVVRTFDNSTYPTRFFVFSKRALEKIIQGMFDDWDGFNPEEIEDMDKIREEYEEFIKRVKTVNDNEGDENEQQEKEDNDSQDQTEKDQGNETEEGVEHNSKPQIHNRLIEKRAKYKIKQDILEYLEMVEEPVTLSELEEVLGYDLDTLAEIIAELESVGEIYEPIPGKYALL